MKIMSLATAFAAVGLLATCIARADFSSTSASGWNVDRYAQNSFGVGLAPDNSSALVSTISSADSLNNRPNGYQFPFYNTQGYSKAVNPNGTGAWSFSASLYLTSTMLLGTYAPMSQELWAGTSDGSPGNQSGFYCMDLMSGMSARSYSATASASSQIGVFDNTTGNWSYFSTAGLTAGWNTFTVSYDGVGTVDYSVDNSLIWSQGPSITSQDPYIGNLTTAYLEDYNFYGNGSAPDSGSYQTFARDVTATTVPEPSTLALAASGGFGCLLLWNRRRKVS